MQTNPPILMFDTNVWLDIYLPHRDGRDTALRLLQEAESKDVALAFPSHSALDVYQRVRSDHKRWAREEGLFSAEMATAIKRLAWDDVNEMRELANAVPTDSVDLYLACKFRDTHDDLEDDLVLAACQRAHVNYLVTSDKGLLAHAPAEVTALTPAGMLELLRAGRAVGSPLSREAREARQWIYEWLANNPEEEDEPAA